MFLYVVFLARAVAESLLTVSLTGIVDANAKTEFSALEVKVKAPAAVRPWSSWGTMVRGDGVEIEIRDLGEERSQKGPKHQ